MANSEPPEPPRGMYATRLDANGRLELPDAFQRFFAALGTGDFRLHWIGDHMEIITEEVYQARQEAAARSGLGAKERDLLKKAALL